MKNLLEVYALAVCFVSVVVFVVISGFGSWAMIEWLAPDFAMSSYDYSCYQSDENYKDCLKSRTYYDKNKEDLPTGEELTRRRLAKYQNDLVKKQRSGKQGMAVISVVFVIASVVFYLHWTLAKRIRQKVKAES